LQCFEKKFFELLAKGINAKTLEISAKSGKDSTSTLSLVIQNVRFKKKLAKNYISIQRGVKLKKQLILMVM
jgi:hypothetical protein